jgi:hypothetical protein
VNFAQLQRFFAEAATSGAGPIAGLHDVFVERDGLSVPERLAIYNRAFFYRQLDALTAVFAETQRALGEVEFTRLGLAYLRAHPSEHPAVERVGRRFPEYLARHAAAPHGPVADIAALEWARLSALVAPNPVEVAQLSDLDSAAFPACRVRLVPSLSFLELDVRALSAFDATEPVDEPSARVAVAVWRPSHVVRQQRLEALEFQALCAAAAGATMAEVCARFDTGEDAADAQRAFQVIAAWYARSWLENVQYAGA